ncbi:hypothetical protein GH714_016053 [Hevea brasiliensis]|uniref:Uncharacterized protein n=1 Tax=Hevea brasiliensis TaxID=3981 RepID=A0A6A6M0E2_HEVBR|nr:hypothetical protein GH714_016053 [Hevea brasiliensis]
MSLCCCLEVRLWVLLLAAVLGDGVLVGGRKSAPGDFISFPSPIFVSVQWLEDILWMPGSVIIGILIKHKQVTFQVEQLKSKLLWKRTFENDLQQLHLTHKSAPTSPAKPIGVSRTRSESFHAIYKVPVVTLPIKGNSSVWAAINAGDRVDSALKDMAIVMKQQNRAEEAIEAIKSLRSQCSDEAQESLDNILLDLYKRCGRLDDQIALLKHKIYLIQQGLAFNRKRTKTARSQGKKFQVSVEQEATRLLGNLGWALMQQNNYVEAEDAYRRALSIAADNNKMCNLGICLMKQGRIAEAKDILRQVKPAVADGPRGDRVEQSRLFDAFLGSSSIWQPQPCKDHSSLPIANASKLHDDFADENIDSNIVAYQTLLSQQKSIKEFALFGNSLNVDAPPFYARKMVEEPTGNQFHETLKRTRSGNAANSNRGNEMGVFNVPSVEPDNPETKSRRLSDETEERLSELLPEQGLGGGNCCSTFGPNK